eukprot:7558378-Alexandrium_andersonii.AAC.1
MVPSAMPPINDAADDDDDDRGETMVAMVVIGVPAMMVTVVLMFGADRVGCGGCGGDDCGEVSGM